MNQRLRAGVVTSIRVNPKDCMGVIDVIERAGVKVDGMSFASMVSLALSSLLETCRSNQVIPERDGFEFNEMVGPYIKQSNAKKVQITKTIGNIGSALKVPALPAAEPAASALIKPHEQTPEQKRAARRLTELLQKKDLAEQSSAVTWQASDQTEFDEVYKIVYPEG